MCCDFFDLAAQVGALEESAVDYLHIDIMDGHFVPNLALGTDFIRQLKKHTSIPLDIHLMTDVPEKVVDWLSLDAGDIVAIHIESTAAPMPLLAKIRECGASPYLVLNPDTSITAAKPFLDAVDGLLVMAVFPGFAGQKMVEGSLDRIAEARKMLDLAGKQMLEIAVDGNVSVENAQKMKAAGANIFVTGTSAVFRGRDIAANVCAFREQVLLS